jgi:hypothetical protein
MSIVLCTYLVVSVSILTSRGSLLFSDNISVQRAFYAIPFLSVFHAFLHYLTLCLLFIKKGKLNYVAFGLLVLNTLFVYYSRGDLFRLILVFAFLMIFTGKLQLRHVIRAQNLLAALLLLASLWLFSYMGSIRYRYDPDYSIVSISESRLNSTAVTWALVYFTNAYDLAAANLRYGSPLNFPFAFIEPFYYPLQLDRIWGDPNEDYQWLIMRSLNNVGGLGAFIRDFGPMFFLELLAYGFLTGVLWKTALSRSHPAIMSVVAAFTFLIFFDAGLLKSFRLFAILAAFYLLKRIRFHETPESPPHPRALVSPVSACS